MVNSDKGRFCLLSMLVKSIIKYVCDLGQRLAKGMGGDVCDLGQKSVKGESKVLSAHIFHSSFLLALLARISRSFIALCSIHRYSSFVAL